jgi:hypothetical protein
MRARLTLRVALYIAGAIAVILALAWLYSAITAKPKAEARLGKNTTEAAQKSGQDAVATVGEVGKRDQAADDLTRSNADDIRHAQGADAPVDAHARDAGLRALCRRATYRNDKACANVRP